MGLAQGKPFRLKVTEQEFYKWPKFGPEYGFLFAFFC